MKIETKYDIGTTLYFIIGEHQSSDIYPTILAGKVTDIEIELNNIGISIDYKIDVLAIGMCEPRSYKRSEDDEYLFTNKEAATAKLFELIEEPYKTKE